VYYGVRRLLRAALLSLAIVVAFAGTAAAGAAAGPPTRGDAKAAFQAFFSGGSAIRAHNPLAGGAPGVPVDPPPHSARIYPFADGAEYCDGWHVVMLAGFGDPATFAGGNAELFRFLSDVDVQFALDGVPLHAVRTSIKRFPHPDPAFSENPLMAVTFGAFLAPGDLSEGTHELRTTYREPGFDVEFTTGFRVVACEDL
jgi:hypothetical protein